MRRYGTYSQFEHVAIELFYTQDIHLPGLLSD